MLVYFRGVDIASHRYWKYWEPERFPEIDAAELAGVRIVGAVLLRRDRRGDRAIGGPGGPRDQRDGALGSRVPRAQARGGENPPRLRPGAHEARIPEAPEGRGQLGRVHRLGRHAALHLCLREVPADQAHPLRAERAGEPEGGSARRAHESARYSHLRGRRARLLGARSRQSRAPDRCGLHRRGRDRRSDSGSPARPESGGGRRFKRSTSSRARTARTPTG